MLKQIVLAAAGIFFTNVSAFASSVEFKNQKLTQLKLAFVEVVENQSFGNCGDVQSFNLNDSYKEFLLSKIESENLQVESTEEYESATSALVSFFDFDELQILELAPKVVSISKSLQGETTFLTSHLSGALGYTGSAFAAVDLVNNQALLVKIGQCEL